MLSTLLRKFIGLILITVSVYINPCLASRTDLADQGNDSDAESNHTTSTPIFGHETEAPFTSVPKSSSQELSANADVPRNDTFTAPSDSLAAPPQKPTQSDNDTMGFVTVATAKPAFKICDCMYKTLSIPEPTTPYTSIEIVRCMCFTAFNPASFQNNPDLTHLVLTDSHLNFSGSEEKIGEGCPNIVHIDLQGCSDLSVGNQAPITPERFAQLAHPDVLLRILSAQCQLLIKNPERSEECYTVEEMKAKFLQSVVEWRSVQKSQEGIYQRIMAILAAGISEFDPTKVAGFGVRAIIKAGTGI